MADNNIRFLDYNGLVTLIQQIKALDTATRAYAGTLPEGAAQNNVLDYVLAQIKASEFSGNAVDVAIADEAGHFTAENVEAALAEIATSVETIAGTGEGSFDKAIKDAIGELKIGEVTYSTVKAYVDALNAAVLKIIHGETGSLNDLTTTTKTNLVAAINEVDAAVKAVDYSGKADKVASATEGNFAGLDANGNLTDSGKKAADFDVAGAAAEVLGTAGDEATANTVYGAKAAAKKAQDDVDALELTVGDMTAVKTTAKTVAGAVDELKDAIDNIDVSGDIQTEIEKLDATITNKPAEGADPDVVVTVAEENGKLTSVTATVTAERFDAYGAASAVQGETTETVASVDAKVKALGTAATKDFATEAIAVESTDANLVSAAQVATFVKAQIAGLQGVLHFRGVVASTSAVENPEAGDVVIIESSTKEYIYDGTNWVEIGDESAFVLKTATIAGIDFQDNITRDELVAALAVKANEVEYKAAAGEASAVSVKDALDDIYSQIGEGGAVADQISAAIAKLDSTVTNVPAEGDAPVAQVTLVQEDGKLKSVSASIKENTFDAYGAAASVQGETTSTVANVENAVNTILKDSTTLKTFKNVEDAMDALIYVGPSTGIPEGKTENDYKLVIFTDADENTIESIEDQEIINLFK